MIDVWSSAGVGLPRMMPSLDNIPLPVDETVFLSLRRIDSHPPDFPRSDSMVSSLLAEMIKVNRILVEINELNKDTVAGHIGAGALEDKVKELSNKLDAWHSNLPSYMHDTPTNLQQYASCGLGRIFVAVYLGYYHFGQLLFYQFLHEDCHSTLQTTHYYANKCKAHAESLCEIVYASHSVPGCDVRYTMVGHILVISSTVQIHTLCFSDSELQIAAARRRLERNFEMLNQLGTYWPTLDIAFTRLKAFHQTCRDSMDESFRLDKWMLKFLYEFAKPVDDKIFGQTLGETLLSCECMGLSPRPRDK